MDPIYKYRRNKNASPGLFSAESSGDKTGQDMNKGNLNTKTPTPYIVESGIEPVTS